VADWDEVRRIALGLPQSDERISRELRQVDRDRCGFRTSTSRASTGPPSGRRSWARRSCCPCATREGPAGWRSVITTPVGGELAFWRQKR
jgi:hypothetical protein